MRLVTFFHSNTSRSPLLLGNFMKTLIQCFLLQIFEGLTLNTQVFPSFAVEAFSYPRLSKWCGKHLTKFSFATESLHMYVHFLTFLPKAPGADVCRLIYAPLHLAVTSPRTEKQSSLEKKTTGSALTKFMDTPMKGRK